MTTKHRSFSNVFALGLCLTFGFACDTSEPLDELDAVTETAELVEPSTPAPMWTADQVIEKASVESIVILDNDEISEVEKQRLIAAADDVVELGSEQEYQRFLAFAEGRLRLLHSSPIGESDAHLRWAQIDEVVEHARIFEYLARQGLLAEIESAVPAGTWLTEQVVREALPQHDLDGLDDFEFDPFVDASEPLELTQAPAANDCGTPSCYETVSECKVTVALVLNHFVFIFYKDHNWYCSDACSCTSGSYVTGC